MLLTRANPVVSMTALNGHLFDGATQAPRLRAPASEFVVVFELAGYDFPYPHHPWDKYGEMYRRYHLPSSSPSSCKDDAALTAKSHTKVNNLVLEVPSLELR